MKFERRTEPVDAWQYWPGKMPPDWPHFIVRQDGDSEESSFSGRLQYGRLKPGDWVVRIPDRRHWYLFQRETNKSFREKYRPYIEQAEEERAG